MVLHDCKFFEIFFDLFVIIKSALYAFTTCFVQNLHNICSLILIRASDKASNKALCGRSLMLITTYLDYSDKG